MIGEISLGTGNIGRHVQRVVLGGVPELLLVSAPRGRVEQGES